MKALPELVVWHLLTFAGFTPAESHVMTCIAKYESSLRPAVMNTDLNRNNSIDIGLLQVNSLWFESSYYCSADRLQNPMYNVLCARQIYNIQGYEAWYGYRNNKEKCTNYQVKDTPTL